MPARYPGQPAARNFPRSVKRPLSCTDEDETSSLAEWHCTLAREATIGKNGNNALSPKFNPNEVATYGVAIVKQPDIGYGPFLAGDGVPVFQQASLAAGVKCSCYPSGVTFDNPAGIASLQFLMDLSLKYHVAPPASEYGSNGAASTNQDVTLFSAGKVAMDVEGDWFTDTIATSAKFSFGVLPIPAGPDGRWSFTNCLIDAINVHSPHQTAAWELEQWLGSPTSESMMGDRGASAARRAGRDMERVRRPD
jgi:multiple sugar transport system substrate-binding protein